MRWVTKARDPDELTLVLSLKFLGFYSERNREVVRRRRESEREEEEDKEAGGERRKPRQRHGRRGQNQSVRRKSLRHKQTWNQFQQI